jgi:hypothetical protein
MSERLRDSTWDRHGVIGGIIGSTPLPKMARIEQKFVDNGLKDIPGTIAKEFARKEIASTIKPGMSVAITAGSRGVANIAVILKEIVEQVKKLGGKPFIFPAMGSHGGATAEGQLEVLASYGVTEKTMGAPIKSSMETIVIGHTQEGKPVYLDKNASQADGILVVGRVKPHTAFRGKYESGLMKMMVIGMGKQKGAQSCHDEGFGKMAYYVEHFGDVHLANTKILFGIAIIENSFDQTCKIEAVEKAKIKEREPVLLDEAKSLMPKILIPKFDILVIDQIGKNFSGDGADPNVSATYCTPYASGGPEFQRYVILDLSDETHGNGIGLGLADFTTKRAFDKFDFDASYPNGLTSTVVSGVRIPVVLKSDKLALQASVFVCTGIDKKKPKIVRIKNTSHIEEIWISEALMDEARKHPQIKIIEEPKDFDFDKDGNLKIGGAH